MQSSFSDCSSIAPMICSLEWIPRESSRTSSLSVHLPHCWETSNLARSCLPVRLLAGRSDNRTSKSKSRGRCRRAYEDGSCAEATFVGRWVRTSSSLVSASFLLDYGFVDGDGLEHEQVESEGWRGCLLLLRVLQYS